MKTSVQHNYDRSFVENAMGVALRVFALILMLVLASSPHLALAQPAPPPDPQRPAYAPGELVNAGHRFFGGVSGGLASVIEHAVSKWGLPNGYVLGEEAGGAFFGGEAPDLAGGWGVRRVGGLSVCPESS